MPDVARRFRKLPIEVEACQFDGTIECAHVLWDWSYVPETDLAMFRFTILRPDDEDRELVDVHVQTLEGRMNVSPGDWIIKGVRGEFYPCNPEVFALTYEPVE